MGCLLCIFVLSEKEPVFGRACSKKFFRVHQQSFLRTAPKRGFQRAIPTLRLINQTFNNTNTFFNYGFKSKSKRTPTEDRQVCG